MSLINKEISDFSVMSYHKGAFEKVTKADVLGKWSLFFFYPADFTFVCPTELEDLQNRYADFCAAGCEIYAVSTDSHFVHKAWHDASERIGKLAAETGCKLIDIRCSFLQCGDYRPLLCRDGIHPNSAGHQNIIRTFGEELAAS